MLTKGRLWLCTGLCAMLAAQPAYAFQNNTWTTVTGYETRQTYYIDRTELAVRLTDFYYRLNPAGMTRTEAAAYFSALLARDGRPAAETANRPIGSGETAVTNRLLCRCLYQTILAAYPDLRWEAGWEAVLPGDLSDFDRQALSFALTRGLLTANADRSLPLDEKLTLGQALETLDKALALAPGFAPLPEPAPAQPTESETPAEPTTAQPAASQGKTVYLTFDDSVSENTLKILDILKKYNAKATFFVAGKGDPAILRRIAAEGHTIAVHTLTHDYATIYTSPTAFWADIDAEADYLEEVTGTRPTLLRFPGGSNNTVSKRYAEPYIMPTLTAQAAEKGYTYIDWNASNGDAAGKLIPKDTLVQNAIFSSKGKQKVIVLMHQTAAKTTTPEALPEILDWYVAEGYGFDTLSETSYNYQFKLK